MLDIVHRLYENYDESYCKEKYLKSKSELLEMINSAMSDTDLKEELLCDTYSFNNCISVYRKVWEKKYSEKEIITKCSETIRIVNYYNSILISLKTFWQKCNCNIDEVNIHQQAISMRMYLFEVISAIQIIQICKITKMKIYGIIMVLRTIIILKICCILIFLMKRLLNIGRIYSHLILVKNYQIKIYINC